MADPPTAAVLHTVCSLPSGQIGKQALCGMLEITWLQLTAKYTWLREITGLSSLQVPFFPLKTLLNSSSYLTEPFPCSSQ